MKRYTDSGERHDERGLKHRDVKTTRIVPIPPELVSILREHIEQHGVASMPRKPPSARGAGWMCCSRCTPNASTDSGRSQRPDLGSPVAVSTRNATDPGLQPGSFAMCDLGKHPEIHSAYVPRRAAHGCYRLLPAACPRNPGSRETPAQARDAVVRRVGRVGLEPTTHGL